MLQLNVYAQLIIAVHTVNKDITSNDEHEITKLVVF